MNRRFFLDQPLPALETPDGSTSGTPVEVLVADARAGLTPADMVERKFVHLLLRESVRTGK